MTGTLKMTAGHEAEEALQHRNSKPPQNSQLAPFVTTIAPPILVIRFQHYDYNKYVYRPLQLAHINPEAEVPCSSANIGPGFDVIGLALSIWLEIRVDIVETETSEAPLNCVITYEGDGAGEVPLVADSNLVTRTALYVLRCHGQRAFPRETRVHIVNPIPLGRGLGSSGAAVVAGVVLGNEVGKLGLSKARMLDYCLMIGIYSL
jgi:hypothetical protein